MCKRNGEIVDCLFLHFSTAMELWPSVFVFFGGRWIILSQCLLCFDGGEGNPLHSGIKFGMWCPFVSC
jgi:hypothetical protein